MKSLKKIVSIVLIVMMVMSTMSLSFAFKSSSSSSKPKKTTTSSFKPKTTSSSTSVFKLKPSTTPSKPVQTTQPATTTSSSKKVPTIQKNQNTANIVGAVLVGNALSKNKILSKKITLSKYEAQRIAERHFHSYNTIYKEMSKTSKMPAKFKTQNDFYSSISSSLDIPQYRVREAFIFDKKNKWLHTNNTNYIYPRSESIIVDKVTIVSDTEFYIKWHNVVDNENCPPWEKQTDGENVQKFTDHFKKKLSFWRLIY